MAIYRKRISGRAALVAIFAAVLSGLTACATSQAPPAPAQSERPPDDSIRFLTSEYDVRLTTPGRGAALADAARAGFVDVPAAELGDQMRKLLENVGRALQRLPDGIGPYALEEIQMNLTVDAKGGVIVTVGATAGITLTLKRPTGGASVPTRTK